MAAKLKTTKTTVKTVAEAPETNGEITAEQAAKEIAKQEAEAAKLAAEAAEAEAVSRDESLESMRPEIVEHAESLEAVQTLLGNALHRAEAFVPSKTYATIQAVAEAFIPEHCGPIWTSSPAYRSLQAARVVESVGAALVGSTSVDALTYLHRFTPEARLAVFRAAKGRSSKPKVSRAKLEEKGRELFPEQAESKKGPKPKTAEQVEAEAREAEAAKQAEQTTVQEILNAIQAVRPESTEENTGPVVKEALGAIGKTLQGHVDEYGGDAYGPALALFEQAVDLCDKWTTPVIRAALKYRAEADATTTPEAVK